MRTFGCAEKDGRGKPRPYNEVRGVSYEDGWVRMRHFVGDSLWIRGSSGRGGAGFEAWDGDSLDSTIDTEERGGRGGGVSDVGWEDGVVLSGG